MAILYGFVSTTRISDNSVHRSVGLRETDKFAIPFHRNSEAFQKLDQNRSPSPIAETEDKKGYGLATAASSMFRNLLFVDCECGCRANENLHPNTGSTTPIVSKTSRCARKDGEGF